MEAGWVCPFIGSGGWVQVIKAGESSSMAQKSRVCQPVLKALVPCTYDQYHAAICGRLSMSILPSFPTALICPLSLLVTFLFHLALFVAAERCGAYGTFAIVNHQF